LIDHPQEGREGVNTAIATDRNTNVTPLKALLSVGNGSSKGNQANGTKQMDATHKIPLADLQLWSKNKTEPIA
jgi:hypothetical protein